MLVAHPLKDDLLIFKDFYFIDRFIFMSYYTFNALPSLISKLKNLHFSNLKLKF